MSDGNVARLGLETDQRTRDRLGTGSSLHPKKRNEGSMYSRACIINNSQLSPRRLQEYELQRGQIRTKWTICKDDTPESPCRGNWRNGWIHPILPTKRSLLSLRQTNVWRVKKLSAISSTGNRSMNCKTCVLAQCKKEICTQWRSQNSSRHNYKRYKPVTSLARIERLGRENTEVAYK